MALKLELDDDGDVMGASADARPRLEDKGRPTPWAGSFERLRGVGRDPAAHESRGALGAADGPFTYWRGGSTGRRADPVTRRRHPTAEEPFATNEAGDLARGCTVNIPPALPLAKRRNAFERTAVLSMLWPVLAPMASASFIGPEDGGSPNANRIHTLYVIVLIVGAVIFVLVEGLLIAVIGGFRRKRGGPEPALVHGNTPLEVGWTIGAAVIVASLAAVTFAFLPSIKNPPI